MYNEFNLHSGSCLRKFFQDFEPLVSSNKLDVVYFGVNDEQVIKEEWDFYNKGNHNITDIHTIKDIRNQQEKANQSTNNVGLTKTDIQKLFSGEASIPIDFESMLHSPSSFVARKFQEVVTKMEKTVDKVFVVFSVEVLDSCSMPGVSLTNFNGLSVKEASEMFGILGKCDKLRTIMITDYNSCQEDFRTGLGICNILYNFCLGLNSKSV